MGAITEINNINPVKQKDLIKQILQKSTLSVISQTRQLPAVVYQL